MVITVDGPAACGKGTIARALAAHYGLPHMDTGLLYRSVALNLLRWGGDPGHELDAVRAAHSPLPPPDDPELRSELVGEVASRLSAFPVVRAALLDRQRAFAGQRGGAVLDGRDTGTVIAPKATAKLFVTASPEIRAARRTAELAAQAKPVRLADVLTDIRARDARDEGRDAAPLLRADDAALLDTGDLTVEQAIARAIAIVDARRR
ncbi:MAG: (d)CMP kinase [Sphingomicrobium sp.]